MSCFRDAVKLDLMGLFKRGQVVINIAADGGLGTFFKTRLRMDQGTRTQALR